MFTNKIIRNCIKGFTISLTMFTIKNLLKIKFKMTKHPNTARLRIRNANVKAIFSLGLKMRLQNFHNCFLNHISGRRMSIRIAFLYVVQAISTKIHYLGNQKHVSVTFRNLTLKRKFNLINEYLMLIRKSVKPLKLWTMLKTRRKMLKRRLRHSLGQL